MLFNTVFLYLGCHLLYHVLCTLQDFFKYWPDFSKTYDKITVQPKSEEDKGGFVIRKFTVTGEQVITVCSYSDSLCCYCVHVLHA